MRTRILIGALVGLTWGSPALAETVDWKGLTWTTRGASTTATVNTSGHLEIFVVDGETSDPGADNWNVYAPLPADLTQANGPWAEFRFLDDGGSGDGPRGYIDTHENGQETMLQGGVYSSFDEYFVNHHTYANGAFVDEDWFYPGGRTAGEHVFMAGMRPDGTVDLWFDGVLQGSILPDPNFTFFETAFLGVTTFSSYTGTYTDFQYGTGYVPEPASLILLALVAACRRR